MNGVACLLQCLALRLQLLRRCFLKFQSLSCIVQLVPNRFYLRIEFLQPLHFHSLAHCFNLLQPGLSQLDFFHLHLHSFQLCPCCFQSQHWCLRLQSPFVSWRLRFLDRPPNTALRRTNAPRLTLKIIQNSMGRQST